MQFSIFIFIKEKNRKKSPSQGFDFENYHGEQAQNLV